MKYEEKVEKIKAFTETDRNDYVSFLNSLVEKRVDTLENASKKNDFLEENPKPDYELKWLDNGIYGELADQPPYQELDFEKFSFTVMKEFVEDELIVETMEAIMEAPEGLQRKKLRIYLFESMLKPRSPYFNVEAYHKVLSKMLEAKGIAEDIIEQEGYTVLTKTFDSFGFLASMEEAEDLQEKVNEALPFGKMTLGTYTSVISIKNVGVFQTLEGEWQMTKTGGTDYDDIKEEIVDHLKELDFGEAHKTIGEYMGKGVYDDGKLKEYNSILNEMKSSTSQSDLGGFN